MVWDRVLRPVCFNLKLRAIRRAFLHPTSTSGCTLICLNPNTIQHLAIYDNPRCSKPGTHQPNPGNCSPDRKTDNHKGFIQSAVYHYTGIMFGENLINPTCNSVTQKALRKENKKRAGGGKLLQRTHQNQSLAYSNHRPNQTQPSDDLLREQVIIQNRTKEKACLCLHWVNIYFLQGCLFFLSVRCSEGFGVVVGTAACRCSPAPSSCH